MQSSLSGLATRQLLRQGFGYGIIVNEQLLLTISTGSIFAIELFGRHILGQPRAGFGLDIGLTPQP